ncbi:MAG: S8 family serine peptidase [Candidatus Bathyarchaeia archaeon]
MKIHNNIAVVLVMALLLSSHLTTIALAFNNVSSSKDEIADLSQSSVSHNFLRDRHETHEAWFDGPAKHSSCVVADGDSVQLIVGVDYSSPRAYNSIADAVANSGGRIVNTVSMDGKVIAVVADIPLEKVSTFKEYANKSPLVRYVEPNMKRRALLEPNDPYWSLQWGPRKIEANWAWNITLGSSDIIVAVIDTGIYYYHEDLAANYVALGYDWVNMDNDPLDDEGHGTHCAGIIASVINNNKGVAGLAQVKIMAEKVLNSTGWGTDDWVANGIIHAADQGAKIISMSLGGYEYSSLLHEAVKYAYEKGVLLVAAAGNDNTSVKMYPAAYEEVIAVAATDENDNRASFSNRGRWIELSAPGVNICSTIPGGYGYSSGTSMACPHIAGVAALVWSVYPSATNEWVRARLRSSADDLGISGFDVYFGYGRVNARKAVEQEQPTCDLLILSVQGPKYVHPGDTASYNVTVLNFGEIDETNVNVTFIVDGNTIDYNCIDLLESGSSIEATFSWTPSIEGTYNLTFWVKPVAGENDISNNVVTNIVRVVEIKGHVLFDQTHGTDNILMYSTWIETLEGEGYVIEVLTTTPINETMLEGYDIFVIPQAQSYYTTYETSIIENFVRNGGGLLVIGDDYPEIYTQLTSFAGISWDWDGYYGYTTDITAHPVTDGVGSVYFASPVSRLLVSFPAQGLIRDRGGNIMLAAAEVGLGAVVCIADEDSINDYNIDYADNLRLALNMISWLANRPPNVHVEYSPSDPYVGEVVTFNASASYDPDGTIVDYFWDFGDGTVGHGTAVVTHVYAEGGTFTVSCTAIDNEGANKTLQVEVKVQRTTLNVQIKVGVMHFAGETAEFYILVSSLGEPVNVNLTAQLYFNGSLHANLTNAIENVDSGLYRIPYTIPRNASFGTYTLIVRAEYYSLSGVSIESFQISQTLQDIFIRVVAINGTTAKMETTLGVVNGTITEIKGSIATIVVPRLGQIETDISNLIGAQEAWSMPQLLVAAFSLVAAVGAILSFALLLKLRKSKA